MGGTISTANSWPMAYALYGSGRALHNALDHHCGDERVRPLWLALRLDVATAQHIPELTRLPMQIGEYLTQFLRFGRHLSRQRHAERGGPLLQHLDERRPLFRR